MAHHCPGGSGHYYPQDLAAAAAGPDVLVACEGLPVRNRVRSLRIPGARISAGVRTASGAIVILPDRLLASIGRWVILDCDLGGRDGQQQLELSADGMRISFDVASVAGGSGTVEVQYRVALDASVLSALPATSFPVTLSHAVEALINPWRGSYAA
jgi:hypothetical protein